jgi:hypothetical protein
MNDCFTDWKIWILIFIYLLLRTIDFRFLDNRIFGYIGDIFLKIISNINEIICQI